MTKIERDLVSDRIWFQLVVISGLFIFIGVRLGWRVGLLGVILPAIPLLLNSWQGPFAAGVAATISFPIVYILFFSKSQFAQKLSERVFRARARSPRSDHSIVKKKERLKKTRRKRLR